MATTRIISMHVSHGKTIADCLTDRIDYSKNPDKTQGGELISAYQCDPKPPTRSSCSPSGSTKPSPAGSSKAT